MYTDLTSHAAFQVDLTPALAPLDFTVERDHLDTVNRTDFQAGLTAGAIIGVDNRQLLGKFFSGPLLGHGGSTLSGRSTEWNVDYRSPSAMSQPPI
jgi:hypothetical protein